MTLDSERMELTRSVNPRVVTNVGDEKAWNTTARAGIRDPRATTRGRGRRTINSGSPTDKEKRGHARGKRDPSIGESDHYHVSRLLNFLVTTLPMSMPRRSTIRWARSGCEVPLKTLMFGILLCRTRTREFSKFARNKLLARTGCDTGITTTENHRGGRPIGDRARTGRDVGLDHAPPTRTRGERGGGISISCC